MVRKRYRVEGYLFPFGYRTLVKSYAARFIIRGYIQYQPDESMEILCEGSSKNIAAFRKEINIRDDISLLGFYVVSIRQQRAPKDGKFESFEIRHCREMTGSEKISDELQDNLMFVYTWAAHQQSEQMKSKKGDRKTHKRD